jgi:hypothetical protein
MARLKTKIGDVFSVKVDDNNKKYFQLIAFDLLQLNSDVIRTFEKLYPLDVNTDLSDVVSGDVDFYAHCVTKLGVKMKVWEKEGNVDIIGDTLSILFRDTNDYGSSVGEKPIKVSNNWYVWRINDEDFTRVGKLEGDNKEAEIGIVMNPYDIIDRIKTGRYKFEYPDFE